MRLNSRQLSAIEYGSDVEGNEGKRVTLRRGVNEISDEDFSFLKASPSFRKHANAGTFVELPPEETEPAPAPVEPPPVAAVDPRARKAKENDKAYNARMKALDEAEADAASRAAADAEFLKAYNDLTEDERKVMYDSLTPDQKKLIDDSVKS